MRIEPAKELTRVKEPEFLFLHEKDFWLRSIWIDLRQAISIDRKSSRDRAPVGLVRCICKDEQVKGPNAPIKLKISNIQVFVPIWMAPTMLRNLRIIAVQSTDPLCQDNSTIERAGLPLFQKKEKQESRFVVSRYTFRT